MTQGQWNAKVLDELKTGGSGTHDELWRRLGSPQGDNSTMMTRALLQLKARGDVSDSLKNHNGELIWRAV